MISQRNTILKFEDKMMLPHQMMMVIKSLALAMFWWPVLCSFFTLTCYMTLVLLLRDL